MLFRSWPDEATLTHTGAIELPRALSLLMHGDRDAVIQGVDAVAPQDRPPIRVVHIAFQIMVACGSVMAALGVFTVFRQWRRRRGQGSALPDDRRFLWALVLASPLGFIALEAGWTVTEVGRQPWIVHDVWRTADAVTPMPGLAVSFALFTLLYIGLFTTVVFLLRRQILKTGVTGGRPLGLTGEMPMPTPTGSYRSLGGM